MTFHECVAAVRERAGCGLADAAQAVRKYGSNIDACVEYTRLRYAAVNVRGDREEWIREEIERRLETAQVRPERGGRPPVSEHQDHPVPASMQLVRDLRAMTVSRFVEEILGVDLADWQRAFLDHPRSRLVNPLRFGREWWRQEIVRVARERITEEDVVQL